MQPRTSLRTIGLYPKQAAFHEAGDKHRERLLMCANRFGKTMCGAAELAFHLTGDYPEWWTWQAL